MPRNNQLGISEVPIERRRSKRLEEARAAKAAQNNLRQIENVTAVLRVPASRRRQVTVSAASGAVGRTAAVNVNSASSTSTSVPACSGRQINVSTANNATVPAVTNAVNSAGMRNVLTASNVTETTVAASANSVASSSSHVLGGSIISNIAIRSRARHHALSNFGINNQEMPGPSQQRAIQITAEHGYAGHGNVAGNFLQVPRPLVTAFATSTPIKPKVEMIDAREYTAFVGDSQNKPEDKVKIMCCICFENLAKRRKMSSRCGHIYCSECLSKMIEEWDRCAICCKKMLSLGSHELFL